MGAAQPLNGRRVVLGCLGLALLYALLVVCYFQWRAWRDVQEVAFTCKLPQHLSPAMIYCAPSGWIFLEQDNDVWCCLPPAERNGSGRLERLTCSGELTCAVLAGDSLYYCDEVMRANQRVTHDLVRVDAPPEKFWTLCLDEWMNTPADVAADDERVYILSTEAELVMLTTGGEFISKNKLSNLTDSVGNVVRGTVSNHPFFNGVPRVKVDSAGTIYCLVLPTQLCAANQQGEVLWRWASSSEILAMEHAEQQGQLYLYDDTGGIVALDCVSGEEAWRVKGQFNNYSREVGFPAVAPDGTALILDGNYSVMKVSPGGATQRLFSMYEYNARHLRTADGGIILLGADDLCVLDGEGQRLWRRELNSNVLLFGGLSIAYYNQLPALTPDGVIVLVQDDVLTGYRPRGIKLAPACP